MSGVAPDKLVARMVEQGFDEDSCRREVEHAAASPAVEAGVELAAAHRKRAALQQALGKMHLQGGRTQPVPRVTDRDIFYRDYLWANRPAIVPGLMADWPALQKWTPEYFSARFGDEIIEVTGDRDVDPLFEDNFPLHRRTMTMRDYVAAIECGGVSNDLYLVAKNGLLSNPAFRALHDDFTPPPDYLDRNFRGHDNARLWVGPGGTVTPLHHDGSNIFFGQIQGRKEIRLIAPCFLDLLYNDRTCFSQVDLANVDDQAFPLMRNVAIQTAIVEPGDFILLPVGWWHWVRAIEPSISLTFHNFYFADGPVIWDHHQ